MKSIEIKKWLLAAVIPLFLLFNSYILKFMETGINWDFISHDWGIYPMRSGKGIMGISPHPLSTRGIRDIYSPIRFTLFSDYGVCSTFTVTWPPGILFFHLDRHAEHLHF